MGNLQIQRVVRLTLGALFWLGALSAAVASVRAVQGRAMRPVSTLKLRAPAESHLTSGDLVFFETDGGLKRVGEVTETDDSDSTLLLALDPSVAGLLNSSTRATCWRTPLSTEHAIGALLPPTIQKKVALQISSSWRQYDRRVTEVWGPILGQLVASYAQWIGDDLEASLRRHELQLWTIAQRHGESLHAAWPSIQVKLEPILRRELAPIVANLLGQAISEAPKIPIAWNVLRGNNDEASTQFFNWLHDHLSEISQADKEEVSAALLRAWEEMRRDPILAKALADLGKEIMEDQELRDVFVEIYRETVADNPRTVEFLEKEIVTSNLVRDRIYELVEMFAPTAQRVAAQCLFNEDGATRPEIVHLVRSIALRRRVAWVTLSTPSPGADCLDPTAVLVAVPADTPP